LIFVVYFRLFGFNCSQCLKLLAFPDIGYLRRLDLFTVLHQT